LGLWRIGAVTEKKIYIYKYWNKVYIIHFAMQWAVPEAGQERCQPRPHLSWAQMRTKSDIFNFTEINSGISVLV
jgi:hypothetical protein